MSRRATAPRRAVLVACACAAGCGGASARGEAPATRAPAARAAAEAIAAPVEDPWADATASPAPLAAATTAGDAELFALCGAGDAALTSVARAIADRAVDLAPAGARGPEDGAARAAPAPALDAASLEEALRAAGEPHVAPRATILRGGGGRAPIAARLRAWSDASPSIGERRCGVARARGADGGEAVAAVAVDALADLAPLATRAHAGTWLTVDARLLTPADGARVVVAGPDGAPRSVPSRVDGGRVVARFAPDRPGAFVVQVVADVAGGPRPVLEARVFADVEPSRAPARAPGEDAAAPSARPDDALAAMVASVRDAARLPPLERDPRLDALALAHATAMRAARSVAHDAGDGDPARRVESANISAGVVGENVAHAATAALAHRALYASPSHRANLLRPAFRRVGVAALADRDGSVWAAEIFTGDPR